MLPLAAAHLQRWSDVVVKATTLQYADLGTITPSSRTEDVKNGIYSFFS